LKQVLNAKKFIELKSGDFTKKYNKRIKFDYASFFMRSKKVAKQLPDIYGSKVILSFLSKGFNFNNFDGDNAIVNNSVFFYWKYIFSVFFFFILLVF
jgi:hypothetical protein